jgi:hypothetical protein
MQAYLLLASAIFQCFAPGLWARSRGRAAVHVGRGSGRGGQRHRLGLGQTLHRHLYHGGGGGADHWSGGHRRRRAAAPTRRGSGRGCQYVYVADCGNHRMVVLSAAGEVVRTLGLAAAQAS